MTPTDANRHITIALIWIGLVVFLATGALVQLRAWIVQQTGGSNAPKSIPNSPS